MMDGWHMNGAWWWFGATCMVIVTALLVWGAIAISRYLGRTNPPADGSERRERLYARDVLDDRFARGEIDEDEYRRRRHALLS